MQVTMDFEQLIKDLNMEYYIFLRRVKTDLLSVLLNFEFPIDLSMFSI